MVASTRDIHGRLRFWSAVLAAAVLLAGGASTAEAQTIRQYQLQRSGSGYELVKKEVATPTAGPKQVLVRVRAASLNRRDIFMLHGQYPGGDANGRIPLSDGAGEVIAVGPGVSRFKVGDRVAGTFFERWVGGKFSPQAQGSARGGESSGMLSEVIVTHEDGLVPIPAQLSFEEASTLPCAGVTAWTALFRHAHLEPGQFVLLEGTGGVSIFGLQFAAAAGAKPIITSSSDEKLARARELGAVGVVNYRTTPDWDKTVRELTGGAGVDHVLEVGGQDTLPKALASLAFEGHVALIGGLTGFGGEIPVGAVMGRGAKVSGIYVGSREDFEAMNAFISKHKLKPVVDKVFSFDDAPAAYALMESGSFFGKIVITL